MQVPAIPEDETRRLAALCELGVLDTPPEERFDRITATARLLFDVPIVLVSLIDEKRQWFKSRQGLDACETARDISFCGHAILGNDVFVVEDTRQDPRFLDNPLVTGEPCIRFYAGAPLANPDGMKLGTLCVIDRKPREFGPRMRALLRGLGQWAERELNLAGEVSLVAARFESKLRLAAVQEIARDTAERGKVERMQREFISTVSHEFRTPLTSIMGSLALIAGGAAGSLPAQSLPLIEVAHRNAQRLVRIINDILDTGKIESGEMHFILRAQELMPVIRQVIEANRSHAEQSGVGLVLAHELPGARAEVDSDRLNQVLTILISNAARFAPAATDVTVAVERRQESIRISVSDRGPGIPAEFQSRIFQKFSQADASDTRQKGGIGLGLSIAKAIVERMRGGIGFDTAPESGTTFFVDLPESRAPGTGENNRRRFGKIRDHQ